MLKKSLFVVVLGLCLSNAPAWASPAHGAADGKEKKAIRLKKSKHAELSLPSQSFMDVSLEVRKKTPKGLAKRDHRSRGHGHRSSRSSDGHWSPASENGAVPAIPEPSALLFFGVGLLVARRAIGATWR